MCDLEVHDPNVLLLRQMKQIMTIATFIYLGRFHNGFMRNKKRSVYPAALHIALVAGEAF